MKSRYLPACALVCLGVVLITLTLMRAPLAVAGTAPAARQVFDYQLPDGRRQLATQRRSELPAWALHQALAQTLRAKSGAISGKRAGAHVLGGAHFVQRESADGWLITSTWEQGELQITQIRPAPGGSQIVESTLTTHRPGVRETAAAKLPSWWPRLHKSWHRVSADGTARTTTMMGWFNGGLPGAQERLLAACARGGFSLLSRTSAPARSRYYRQGVVLTLSNGTADLVVTLSGGLGKTGVVAHLRQRMP